MAQAATPYRQPEEHYPLDITPDSTIDDVNLDNPRELHSAFELFNQMSQQLADSYQLLESQVTQLTSERDEATAQRLQELKAREQLASRLETLLNVLPGGVVVLNNHGQICEANPAAQEMLDRPLEGCLWRDIIDNCFAPRYDDGHEVSTRNGRRISIATRSLADNGQIILLTDLTETRRLQDEVSRNERLSALGKMVSALAHQIRTPLTAAMLYTGNLCDGVGSLEKLQDMAQKIMRRLNNMEQQVRDMMFFVKGELVLNDVISLSQLQSELIDACEVSLEKSDSLCCWDFGSPEQLLRCNREALIGAIQNLINNAIQAVDSQAKITVSGRVLCEGDSPTQLQLQVTDKGPGIPLELLDRVQELFVTTKAQGTGLGLAVVQSVATAHRGQFNMTSKPHQGACAEIVIPLSLASSEV